MITARIGDRRAWAMVVVLAMLSIVSFVDRQVLSVLVMGIEHDLAIGDVAIGWLLGPAFVLTYNIVLIPLAFLIDARNRKWLIIAAVILWCSMTLLTATAHGFGEFALYRSGLAIGEAVLGPAAVSLIGDLFDRERRVLPMAIYLMGSTIGQSGAALFGAAALQIVALMHRMSWFGAISAWRIALVLVAVPGLLLIAVLAVIAREPARGGTVAVGVEADRDGESLAVHLRKTWLPYLLIAVFAGCVNMLAIALTLWGPAYFIRAFVQTPIAAGYLIGGVSLTAGIAGCLALPALLRRRAVGVAPERGLITIAAAAFAIAVPAVLLYGLAPNLAWALVGLAIAMTALTSIFSVTSQFVQLRTPSRLRARALSAMLFVVFLIAGGIGPVLLPILAGRLFNGADALGRATATLALGAGLLAAPLLWALLRYLGRSELPAPVTAMLVS